MAQIEISQGLTTHTLPYPSDYNESQLPRAANHVSYGGYRLRDRRLTGEVSLRAVQMQWQYLSSTELGVVAVAHADLQGGDLWDYASPDGTAEQVRINPDLPELNVVRFADAGGNVLYTARWNVIMVTS